MNRRADMDRIAQEAARLYEQGVVETIPEAIATAGAAGTGHERPSVGMVRQHLQAMAMQALGEDGYRRRVRQQLSIPESLMTALTEMLGDVDAVVVGRAALGLVDGPGQVHIRLYTDRSIKTLADRLIEMGYEEPVFETANTRHGRLNRILVEDEGVEMVLTRCSPDLRSAAEQDLFSGKLIAHADLKGFRQLIGGL